jgi:hypothetical protein
MVEALIHMIQIVEKKLPQQPAVSHWKQNKRQKLGRKRGTKRKLMVVPLE